MDQRSTAAIAIPGVTTTPSVAARDLSNPRPNGDLSYSYKIPADRHDGIATGDIAQSDLGADIAAKIAKGILDETWNDIHSVLLYQHGKLVYEEYFHGYAWNHPHQLRSATKSVTMQSGLACNDHDNNLLATKKRSTKRPTG